MTTQERNQMDELGYVRLDHFMTPEFLDGLRNRVEELFEAEGENAGAEFRKEENTRRLANLVDKGKLFQEMVVMPEIMERVEAVLGAEFKLSSLNARSANPYSYSRQTLHSCM